MAVNSSPLSQFSGNPGLLVKSIHYCSMTCDSQEQKIMLVRNLIVAAETERWQPETERASPTIHMAAL